MYQVIVLYGVPTDPAAFDQYYEEVHTPLVKAIPHLKSFSVSKGPITIVGGGGPYYRIALLGYADLESLEESQMSSEGMKASMDAANFATGGMTALVMEIKDEL
ncbi:MULTISPECIES: EthD family reductase [Pseudomonas]|jgi:uncharacterized protein (TIGR02118 family)|uniref:EthD family reductase n=1 Tax=Pseudomonas carnis TaxID=2487355 RepID=A0ABT5RLW9_9PSED|nr:MULTISPECIES: EthD family reductase [Pseudomonas]MBH3368654.1 EthD family reductase [Pseudomonas carnis]MBX9410370.1 EthD family reductase [Pseudomonas baetica]MDD1947002.1 EthD family reductase [Pseudomonas carnis]MDI3186212.1 EthD family reductase [Pseudomonas paracarnis]NMZ41003.1 EthD family reductase [Pseudomonas proteolytica]